VSEQCNTMLDGDPADAEAEGYGNPAGPPDPDSLCPEWDITRGATSGEPAKPVNPPPPPSSEPRFGDRLREFGRRYEQSSLPPQGSLPGRFSRLADAIDRDRDALKCERIADEHEEGYRRALKEVVALVEELRYTVHSDPLDRTKHHDVLDAEPFLERLGEIFGGRAEAEQAPPSCIAALRSIVALGGNLPDDRLTNPTGPNDAAHRGEMYASARRIARLALEQADMGGKS